MLEAKSGAARNGWPPARAEGLATRQTEPIAAAVVLLALAGAAGCYFPTRAATRANLAELLRQG